VIEMPGSLISTLRAHKLASPYSKPDDLVFAERDGTAFEHRKVTKQGLERACKRADIAKPWPSFHELRHTHASAWIAQGGDVVELSSRLGHADPSITAGVYSHEFEAAARSAERRARLDAMYGAEVPNVAASVAAAEVNSAQSAATGTDGEVVDLQAKRQGRQ
jgi:integrase